MYCPIALFISFVLTRGFRNFALVPNSLSVMIYTVFLNLEPYLAQWLQHESGGEYPIKLKRGSAEAVILECFLKLQPKEEDYVPQLRPEEGQVEIVLPCFKRKDIRTYNYLPPRAAILSAGVYS